jgi:isocitrate lyase
LPAVIGDGDTGYGNAVNVKRTVAGYAAAGFAGILIEDQQVHAAAQMLGLLWSSCGACLQAVGRRINSKRVACLVLLVLPGSGLAFMPGVICSCGKLASH